jgi:hypothetical protein
MTKYITALKNFFGYKNRKTTTELPSNKMSIAKATKIRFFFAWYIIITMIFCPFFTKMVNDFASSNEYHFYYFFFGIYFFNIFIFSRFVPYREYTIDLSWELLGLYWSNVRIFFNIIWIRILKVLNFILDKTKRSFTFIKFIFAKVRGYFLTWKPLFKRLSYFGNYKSSRSKFINKD